MDSHPLLSIIIPVYNSERYLGECIQSVLKQDAKNLEIILINDGSTDKSGDICRSYSRQNAFIKTIHCEKNLGVSASRNNGIQEARGRYIIFLDSDDRLFEGCLDGISRLLEGKPNVDVIIGKYITQRYGQGGEEIMSQDFAFDNEAIEAGNPDSLISQINDFARLQPYCWRYVISRDFIINNDLFFIDVKIYEDMAFTCKLLCLAGTFLFYDQCLYWHRARPGSLAHSSVHSNNSDDSLSYLEVASELCKFVNFNVLTDLKKAFALTRAKDSMKAFYGCLPMHAPDEILGFAKRIGPNISPYKILGNGSSNGIYPFLEKLGTYKGLLALLEGMTKRLMGLGEQAGGRETYLFCADLFGRAAAHLLQGGGYAVKGFLDNNRALAGHTLLGLNISHPSILENKPKGKLSHIFVIVCHQQKPVFDKIKCQLEEIGLAKKQIAHQLF